MARLGRLLSILASVVLSGCGSYVPDIQEFYEKPSAAPILVSGIVQHVECEVRHAVQSVMIADIRTAELAAQNHLNQGRSLQWMASYAAQITLTLTLEETGSFNPGVAFNNPMPNAITNINPVAKTSVSTPQSSSVGLAAALSSKATRKDTLSLFVDFGQFANEKALAAERAAEDAGHGFACKNKQASFIEGDLKLQDWLNDVLLQAYGDPSYQHMLAAEEVTSKKDVIQHEASFVVTYNGGITPGWKLVRISANQGNMPLFFGQRANTQDVIITIGPQQKGVLNPTALNTLLSSQINNARYGN